MYVCYIRIYVYVYILDLQFEELEIIVETHKWKKPIYVMTLCTIHRFNKVIIQFGKDHSVDLF